MGGGALAARPAGRPALTARRGGSGPRDGGVEATSTRRGGGGGRRGGGVEAADIKEARRGGNKGNGGGAPGFGVEGSSRKPERSRRGGGARGAAAEDNQRGAWKEEVRKKREKIGHGLIYTKGLRHRVIISTGAFEGLRHQFVAHPVP